MNLQDVFVELQTVFNMGVKLYEKPENQSPGPLIAIVIIIMLLLLTSKCHAQQKAAIDTMVARLNVLNK